LLVLFAVVAFVAVHERILAAAAKPEVQTGPSASLQPSVDQTTRFDLLFRKPEFALP
jgi:hypothetical protein